MGRPRLPRVPALPPGLTPPLRLFGRRRSKQSTSQQLILPGLHGQPAAAAPAEPLPDAGYAVRRSHRARRVVLRVTAAGLVEVVIPWRARVRPAEIESFVLDHADWISATKKRLQVPQRLPFEQRETILWRGTPTCLRLEAAPRGSVTPREGHVTVAAPHTAASGAVFAAWAARQALPVFEAAVAHHAAIMGVSYEHVRVSNAATRWGSCSARGRISLSWRLMLAPPQVLDAVVAHELAHVRVPNHSADFYRVLLAHCPDYRNQHRWLKEHIAELRW